MSPRYLEPCFSTNLEHKLSDLWAVVKMNERHSNKLL